MGASLRTEKWPPPLLPSSRSSLEPVHVGLRQHPSTVGALPPLCSVHSWCKGLAPCAASCPPLASLASSLLPAMPARALHVSSMPCYVVFGDIFATCSAPCSTGIFRSLSHAPLSMVSFQLLSEAKVALHLLHVNVFLCFFMHSHLVDSESAL